MVAHIPPNTDPIATPPFDPVVLLYIALSFGFSLAVNVWIFFRVSGGLFNPAVTFAFWLVGNLSTTKAATIFVAQMLGGIVAAAIVSALFPTPLDVGTKLGGGTSVAQGLFIEMFLTAELVFTVFMLAAEKHRATFLAPIGIGLVFFVIELVGVHFTGGSANPTRSFGPCVVNRSFPHEHWIYWLGPALGAVLAATVYKLMKTLEYEHAVRGPVLRPPLHPSALRDQNLQIALLTVRKESGPGRRPLLQR